MSLEELRAWILNGMQHGNSQTVVPSAVALALIDVAEAAREVDRRVRRGPVAKVDAAVVAWKEEWAAVDAQHVAIIALNTALAGQEKQA